MDNRLYYAVSQSRPRSTNYRDIWRSEALTHARAGTRLSKIRRVFSLRSPTRAWNFRFHQRISASAGQTRKRGQRGYLISRVHRFSRDERSIDASSGLEAEAELRARPEIRTETECVESHEEKDKRRGEDRC